MTWWADYYSDLKGLEGSGRDLLQSTKAKVAWKLTKDLNQNNLCAREIRKCNANEIETLIMGSSLTRNRSVINREKYII
jgi:hypothetical protein